MKTYSSLLSQMSVFYHFLEVKHEIHLPPSILKNAGTGPAQNSNCFDYVDKIFKNSKLKKSIVSNIWHPVTYFYGCISLDK